MSPWALVPDRNKGLGTRCSINLWQIGWAGMTQHVCNVTAYRKSHHTPDCEDYCCEHPAHSRGSVLLVSVEMCGNSILFGALVEGLHSGAGALAVCETPSLYCWNSIAFRLGYPHHWRRIVLIRSRFVSITPSLAVRAASPLPHIKQ